MLLPLNSMVTSILKLLLYILEIGPRGATHGSVNTTPFDSHMQPICCAPKQAILMCHMQPLCCALESKQAQLMCHMQPLCCAPEQAILMCHMQPICCAPDQAMLMCHIQPLCCAPRPPPLGCPAPSSDALQPPTPARVTHEPQLCS